MIYSTTIAPFQHHRLLPIPLSLLPIFFATFIFKLYVIFASFIITTKKPCMDDLRSSVLAEVVGMSYHQSWPRHQTWKRHHSLQVSTSPACHHHHRLFLLCITGKLLWPRLFLCHRSWQFLTSLQFMLFLCMESTLISQSSALPSDIDTNGSSRWDSFYTIHGKTRTHIRTA